MAEKSLSELIASLPEEERIILSLHYLKGHDALAIANLLGVPERAVLSLITIAKTRLISALDPNS